MLELLAVSLIATATASFNPERPSSWKLAHKLPPKSALREAVIAEWTAAGGSAGEAALTRAEAEAILDDPRAQATYGDHTVSVISPSSVARQRRGHQDLLKVFLQPERVTTARRFFRAHEAVLLREEKDHNVDPTVVVSILVWESNLGTITGSYSAFNIFTSQAFFIEEASRIAVKRKKEQKILDPAKQKERVETIGARARRNLAVLVRTSKARKIDPLALKSSWAGAIGYPQFMPATLEWAEDGDGDGKIDLYGFDDSIASIARYLEASGFAASRQKAVWAYNHEQAYVDGVLAFADALKASLVEPPDAGASDAAPKPSSADAGVKGS